MAPIIIDAVLRDKLLAVNGTVELQDDTGRVFGQFVPKPASSIWDEIDAPSDEELDRQLLEGPRVTAEAVMERLRSLTRSE